MEWSWLILLSTFFPFKGDKFEYLVQCFSQDHNHKNNELWIGILTLLCDYVLPISNYAPCLVTHGLMTETTMIITKMRSIMMAIHIHFLEFFCSFFAFWRVWFPCCTWSTALETWCEDGKNKFDHKHNSSIKFVILSINFSFPIRDYFDHI